jgi:K(+)-stimulated pyrophosphate-energized sodium pump
MDQLLFWLVPAASVLALCFAWYFHRQMMKESEGTPQMVKIAAAVRKGARTEAAGTSQKSNWSIA